MSEIADAKKNWLEDVKQEAERLTRERMAVSKVRQAEIAERIETQSAPKAAKKGTDK